MQQGVKEYVFTWGLRPAGIVTDTFSLESGPLIVTVRGDRIEFRAWAEESEKEQLQRQAAALAGNLAVMLSIQYGTAITLGPTAAETYHVEPGVVRKDIEVRVIGGQFTMTGGAVDFELRDANGNVIDSSEMRRQEERRRLRGRSIQLAARACDDTALREMLQHRAQYEADLSGRLHHLFDILEVAERVHGSRRKAADELHLSDHDLSELARIANDKNLINGRHPGQSSEHHLASPEEVAICERVADMIIDAQASWTGRSD